MLPITNYQGETGENNNEVSSYIIEISIHHMTKNEKNWCFQLKN